MQNLILMEKTIQTDLFPGGWGGHLCVVSTSLTAGDTFAGSLKKKFEAQLLSRLDLTKLLKE